MKVNEILRDHKSKGCRVSFQKIQVNEVDYKYTTQGDQELIVSRRKPSKVKGKSVVEGEGDRLGYKRKT